MFVSYKIEEKASVVEIQQRERDVGGDEVGEVGRYQITMDVGGLKEFEFYC